MAVQSDKQQILQELNSLKEELKTRDERIERLEKALVFFMGSKASPDYHDKSAQVMLGSVIPASLGWINKILNELGSGEKILEEFAAVCEKRLELKNR